MAAGFQVNRNRFSGQPCMAGPVSLSAVWFIFQPPIEGFSSIFFRSTWGLLFANLEAKVSQSLQMGEIFYCFGQGSITGSGLGHSPRVQEQMASLLGTRVSGQKWAPRAEAEPSLPAEHSSGPLRGLRRVLAEACRWPCGQVRGRILPVRACEPSWGGSRCAGWGCCL